jgi:transcriptional regulator
VLIHPWDAFDDGQWRDWLRHNDFGELVVPAGDALPVVVPTHFAFDGEHTVWLHLARPNPVWPALEAARRALLVVSGDVAYVRSDWDTRPENQPRHGVPTSYYSSVQLECDAQVIDDPMRKAEVLNRQLGHFEPGSARAEVSHLDDHDRRRLPGIRAIRLTVTGVRAKAKYGGNRTEQDRIMIADRFDDRGRAEIADRLRET